MDRKTRPTICETIISDTWYLLEREISLDNDVKLMISEGIITENEVTDIMKDNEGEHQKIVKEILFSIQKQGSRGMHTLLEILKSNGNTKIFDALIEASGNKDASKLINFGGFFFYLIYEHILHKADIIFFLEDKK